MAASIEDLLAKADQIKDDDAKNDGRNKMRSAFAGAIIGGVVGLMIGYSRGWNILYAGIGGAALGGAITYVFTPES